MTEHRVKSWPEFFEPLFEGAKNFELRRNDRNYRVGDLLILREWEPKLNEHDRRLGAGTFTGRECHRWIKYIMTGTGPSGIEPLKGLGVGYCILGLEETD